MALGLLRDSFLQGVCEKRVLVSVYLVNGIKLQGYITAFDEHVVLLKNTSEQIIFKHAIATVVSNASAVFQDEDFSKEEGCLREA